MFVGLGCVRGCELSCSPFEKDVAALCIVYKDEAACCEGNMSKEGCGIDFCSSYPPTFATTTLTSETNTETTTTTTSKIPEIPVIETPAPTPAATEGSTPTVSTEVTGPPTKARSDDTEVEGV